MTRRRLFFTILLAMPVMAQNQSITVTQLQTAKYACNLEIGFDPQKQPEAGFFSDRAPGADLANYSLYAILDNDTPDVRACDVSRDYIDPGRAADSKSPSLCAIPGNDLAQCPVPGKKLLGLGTVLVPLLKPLKSDVYYLLVIKGIGPKGDTKIPIKVNTSLDTSEIDKRRSTVKVSSNIALAVKDRQPVIVERATVTKTAQGVGAAAASYPGYVDSPDTIDDGVVIRLTKNLPSGDSQLKLKGLTDYYGTKVEPKGKITIAGAPADVSNAFVTTSVSATAGVHTTPAFSATGAVAPWHPAVWAVIIPHTAIRVDPSVNFDVGSASTQTKNSIIAPAFFSTPLYFGLPSVKAARDPNQESREIPTKGTRPSVLNLSYGPREEIDTKYGGVNVLGEVRSELYLPMFSHTADVKQADLGAGNPAIRDLLELPNNGYALAPYLEFDGGGHVNSQVVTSGKSSVDVPTYNIARLYLGMFGTLQEGIFTFSVNSSWVDLLTTETVAYTSGKQVLLRNISGWQPNTTVGVVATFDKAKHYGLTLSYQNGRSAPNFQYLNKVTAGIKVTY